MANPKTQSLYHHTNAMVLPENPATTHNAVKEDYLTLSMHLGVH